MSYVWRDSNVQTLYDHLAKLNVVQKFNRVTSIALSSSKLLVTERKEWGNCAQRVIEYLRKYAVRSEQKYCCYLIYWALGNLSNFRHSVFAYEKV